MAPARGRPQATRGSSTHPEPQPNSILHTELRNLVQQGDGQALKQKIAQERQKGVLEENHLRTALQSACKSGNAAIVQVLLEEDAPTDLQRNRGFPALHWAVTKGHTEVVKLLLTEKGYKHCPANIDWRDQDRRAPVWFHAALSGQIEVLRLLLDRVVDINAIDKDGRTVLHTLAHDTGVASNIASGQDVNRGSLENDVQRAASANRARRGSQTSGGEGAFGKKDAMQKLDTVLASQTPSGQVEDQRSHSASRTGARRGSQTSAGEQAPGKKDKVRKLRPHRRLMWNEHPEIVSLILAKPINVNIQDYEELRTPLHWAAATGKLQLAEQLLTRKHGHRASVNVKSGRGKTALHLACSAKNANPKMVDLLLRHGADARARSDGNWTCLHNSVHEQSSQEIIDILLYPSRFPDLLNATTIKGMTPLHIAAESGSDEVVDKLISYEGIQLNVQDAFHMTPMLRAAQKGHIDIAKKLAPCSKLYLDSLNKAAVQACNEYQATIVDFRPKTKVPTLRQERSVFELLYGWDANSTTDVAKVPLKQNTQPKFRWIHLPANNTAWVEALVAKAFLEAGAKDIEGTKSIQRCFNQQRVRAVKRAFDPDVQDLQYRSSFMKPHCQRTVRGSEEDVEGLNAGDSSDGATPGKLSRVRTFDGDVGRAMNQARINQSLAGLALNKARGDKSNPSDNSGGEAKKQAQAGTQASGSNSKSSKKRQRKPSGLGTITTVPTENGGPLHNSTSSLTPTRSHSLALEQLSMDVHGGVVTLFMPYLHFETDANQRQLGEAVRKTISSPQPSTVGARFRSRSFSRVRAATAVNKDVLLIEGYLRNEPGLQLRRTLDQSYLRGIDTTQRDSDQVIGRYCQRHNKEEKIYMVDSLWMFVIGPQLIVTAFPERWSQPLDDPLNLLDGIIQEVRIHSKTSRSVQSVHDLALLIANRCSGAFDRHVAGEEDYQFLDMFESSISYLNVQHSQTYENFYEVSREAHQYLRTRSNKTDRMSVSADQFLGIDKETELLKEVRDVAEEIQMIQRVLDYQTKCLADLSDVLCDEVAALSQKRLSKGIKARAEESKGVIKGYQLDLERMTDYAQAIEGNLINLLDLKQKQANALEARFSRDQGQVVLIFTIVTILFVPGSFLAQFMSISIAEFERDSNGNLPLSYVLKWILGIGLGFTVFFVALAFSLRSLIARIRTADLRGKFHQMLQRRREATPPPPPVNVPPVLLTPHVAEWRGGGVRKSLESSRSQISTIRPPHLAFDLLDARGRERGRSLRDLEHL